jgi:hypothetical protein
MDMGLGPQIVRDSHHGGINGFLSQVQKIRIASPLSTTTDRNVPKGSTEIPG